MLKEVQQEDDEVVIKREGSDQSHDDIYHTDHDTDSEKSVGESGQKFLKFVSIVFYIYN